MQLRIASLGFGNVGRAVVAMLQKKERALAERHGVGFLFTGALTRRRGGWLHPEGVGASELQASGWPDGDVPQGSRRFGGDGPAFARECGADVLLELTTLSPEDGEPATSHVRAALLAGSHVVTANKGPIAHAYRELGELARSRGLCLRFESTVMDGTPIFGMAEACLPAAEISGLQGVLNSTSNFILAQMARGAPLEAALAKAQRLGIAEANPAFDLEGWDASVKAVVLANVLMGAKLRPREVERRGLGAEAMRARHAGLRQGETLKQLVEVERQGGAVRARVFLQALGPEALFSRLTGMEAALTLHTDTLGDLTLVEGEGGPEQTASGVIADLVNVARALRRS